jgi:hypothetical protein
VDRLIAGLVGVVIGTLVGGGACLLTDDSETRVIAANEAARAAAAKAGELKASLDKASAEATREAKDLRSEIAAIKAGVDGDLLVQLTRERIRAGKAERELGEARSVLSSIAPDRAAELIAEASRVDAKPIEISAADLYEAYSGNEVDADNRYGGKKILVSGTVESVGKALLGEPYVAIGVGHAIFSVQCVFDSPNGLESLRPGDRVSIEGICSGVAMNVIVRECVLR